MGAAITTLAAVDLGSNSFRLILANVVNGHIQLDEGLRETVRLGAGLLENGDLDEAAIVRAEICLSQFKQHLQVTMPDRIKVVGTNTLRVAKNIQHVLPRLEAALGYPIDIIPGQEEARLVYQGAMQSLPISDARRLVVDIGGGSTEIVVGQHGKPLHLNSLCMGCVSFSRRYFPDQIVTTTALASAKAAARDQLSACATLYAKAHWDEAIGTSGTIRSVADIMRAMSMPTTSITQLGLATLETELLQLGEIKPGSLPGLRASRAPVLAGGFAILSAVFDVLGIETLSPAEGALREGILYDLLQEPHA